jgi:outer membrane murein-binding lipoprotein Lpp
MLQQTTQGEDLMKKSIAGLVVAGAMVATLAAGCSSRPSAEELKQLEDLRAEVSSLERGISARESEKAALLKAIADKDAQLSQCLKDKALVQERLRGM